MKGTGRLLAMLGVTLVGCEGNSTLYVGTDNRTVADGVAGGGAAGSGVAGGGAEPECLLRGGEARYVSLTSGGVSRRYFASMPSGYDPDRSYPVVFVFHARDEDGVLVRDAIGLEAAAPADWGVFIYPDGMAREWTDGSVGTGWQNGPATTYYGGTEDLDFTRDVVAHLEAHLCLRIADLYATGRWWGGEFASVLGCYAGDLFDAVVPIHGNTPYFLPPSPEADPPCVGKVAEWGFHGKGDPMFPLEDGLSQRDFWLAKNDCDSDSAASLTLTGASADDDCVEYACRGPTTRFCAFAARFANAPPLDYYPAAVLDFLQALQ